MKPFPVKSHKLDTRGLDNKQVVKKAQDYFKVIEKKTKRQPYLRSAYFGKQKIFFTYFWKHLYQKPPRQRRIRVEYLPCAIELIQKCRNAPESMVNVSKQIEILHRFTGITKNKDIFYVQIKENRRTDRKEFCLSFLQRNKSIKKSPAVKRKDFRWGFSKNNYIIKNQIYLQPSSRSIE